MNFELTEHERLPCPLCNCLFSLGKFVWSDRLQDYVCPDCLDEAESCGCEDA